jgi:hypothetical protein
MRNCKIRRNTFGNTGVYEIWDVMYVRRPVSRMARGEVGQVVAFKCFKDFTTTRCDAPGSPISMFGIVIATCNESWSEDIVKVFKLCFTDRMFRRKINNCNC